ncbi:MAG: GGDEF domain-containing protein, partial [Solirubrobacteraceae bacterium]|nr:GGDEF domain-containing protein [Patulibacter sp.]
FKTINDSYGHASGDHVIVEVGAVIERSVRAGDIVARLGGDEFAILLPEADAAAAEAVAQRLVADTRMSVRAPGAPDDAVITLSVGVAVLAARPGLAPDQVLEEADRAMYRAKKAGRDGYALTALSVA